jgi:uncharacterized protein (TIGR00661 family)
MRLLYGVVGDGMGHATRSRVVMEHLLARGHEIHVVVSDRAFKFLSDVFAGERRVVVHEIHGLRFTYRGAGVDKSATLKRTLREIPAALRKNIDVYRKLRASFEPQMVFTDFESWAYVYARHHRLPVVSIDNQQVIDRCRHPRGVTDDRCKEFVATRVGVNLKTPRAYHYLATTFFFPPIVRPRTTLVPPILRPEILAARREPGRHVLVYQTSSTNVDLVPTLAKLPFDFRVYGMNRAERVGRVELKAFSQQGFVDDLRTARAVIAGGGFSLMGEAVHLRVPMLCVPLEGQWEQQLNARWLAKLGYGAWAPRLDEAVVRAFLDRVDEYAAGVARYVPRDDAVLFDCVDRLVARVARGEKAPRDPMWSPGPSAK